MTMAKHSKKKKDDDTVLPVTSGALGNEKPKKRPRQEPDLEKAAAERKAVQNEPSTSNVLPALRETPKPPSSNLAGIPELQLRSALGVRKTTKKSCRAMPFQETNASNCLHFALETGAYEWVHLSKNAVSMLLYTSIENTPVQGADTDEGRATSWSTRRGTPHVMLDPDVGARSFFTRADVIINNVLVPTNNTLNQIFTTFPRYQAVFEPEDPKCRKPHFKKLSDWNYANVATSEVMKEATRFFSHSSWDDTQHIRVWVPLDGIFPFDTKAAIHQAIEGAPAQVLYLPPSTKIELKLYFHQQKTEALFHNEVNSGNYYDMTVAAAGWQVKTLRMTMEQAVMEYTAVELFPEQHTEQMKLYRGDRIGFWDYDIARAQHQSILSGTSYAEATFQIHPYCRSILIAFQPDHAVLVQPHKKRPLTGWSTFPAGCTKITCEYANTEIGNDLIRFGIQGINSELSMGQYYNYLKELRLAENFTMDDLFPRNDDRSLVQYLVYDVRHLIARTMQTLRIGMEFNGTTTSPANHQVVCLSFHPNGRAEIQNHSSEGTEWQWTFLQTG